MIGPLTHSDFTIHEVGSGRQISGPDLIALARVRAAQLGAHIGRERRNIVIAHGNTIDFFADLLGIWCVGGVAICINPGLTRPELELVAEFSRPAAILTDGSIADVADVATICTWAEPVSAPAPPMHAAGLDDPALILFTSGTTGQPKGVVHSHRSLLARVSLNVAHLEADVLTKSLCVLPTHFGHGLIGNCLTALAAGGTLYLYPNTGMAGAAALGAVIDEHEISFLSSVPSFWKLALRVSPPPAGGTLKRINIGSAPLAGETWTDVISWAGGAAGANMYGITETANWIGAASSADFTPEDGLLGRLWGGAAAIRSGGGTLAENGAGEIMVRTPSLMSGYFQRPDLSAQVLVGGWYATGDTGTLDNGVLRLTGRAGNVIIQAGINIHPEELDLLFERHDDVAEACAFGLDDPVSGQAVALAVTLRKGAAATGADLADWAQSRLRADALPQRYFVLPEIPKTDRGKLNRALVAKACEAAP